ncbi:restriction endonuclease [Pseudomonas viridiflava]|uniref:restriction endonuclease n=1 Tax=Pseudomonas viridiflava TaxID=33069 RepID=UPI002EBE059F|nr:restriction endonuclease [Pseudomonas viridiflava]
MIKEFTGRSSLNGYKLELLCGEILKANGWSIDVSETEASSGFDIVANEKGANSRVAFEIKYTRNSSYPTSALQISASRLMAGASLAGINKAVLIVATDVHQKIKTKIQDEFKVQVIDLNELLILASTDLELLVKLVKLCEVDLSDRPIDKNIGRLINPESISKEVALGIQKANGSRGHDLIGRLKAVPYGREGCYDYEDIVTEILKYLFDENLTGWHQQAKTTDTLHRYDLVCRVIDSTTIWRFVARDLDSRYVLFEFKNYSEKLSQGQVYSTEKYLLDKAKRKVCFLISRHGPSDNAFVACQGAMREHGKLIICLEDGDIVRLIESRMLGNDPNEIVFEKIDRFLMELPR